MRVQRFLSGSFERSQVSCCKATPIGSLKTHRGFVGRMMFISAQRARLPLFCYAKLG